MEYLIRNIIFYDRKFLKVVMYLRCVSMRHETR